MYHIVRYAETNLMDKEEKDMDEKYSLVGVDGNAYAVMGYTAKAMRREGFSQEEIKEMHEKAMSDDYNNLLMVCMEYVDKANERAAS